jgi:hypothetical protein
MAEMGIDALRTNLTNPARDFLWDVLIPVPVGNGDFSTFQLRAQSSNIPGRSNEAIAIPYKGTAGIVVAGKLTYSHEWACTFIEGEDKKVFDAVHSWQQDITNNISGIGVGDPFYKTDVYITLLETSGDTFMKIKMKGAWIKTVADVPLAYESNNTIKYSVTFAYDSWEDMTS